MVAAAIADNGRLMVRASPRRSVRSRSPATIKLIRPQLYQQVMSAKTAQDVDR